MKKRPAGHRRAVLFAWKGMPTPRGSYKCPRKDKEGTL